MNFVWFAIIVLVLVTVAWVIGDRFVGMGDTSFFPKELLTYVAGIINGLCFGLNVRHYVRR